MVRISVMCLAMLSVCAAHPALAQNNISCSSGTACTAGTIPVFATSGGAAQVDSSIVSQSGSILDVAGSVSANSFDIGKTAFAFGNLSNENVFVGFAGNATTTGTDNTAVGASALKALTTGVNNTAIGGSALAADTTGSGNMAIGTSALKSNSTGNNNAAVGIGALLANTTGSSSAAFGYGALNTNTTGNSNSAFGYEALFSNTNGKNNSAFGLQTLYTNTSGIQNQAFGFGSLFSNTSGNGNSAFGTGALLKNTTGGSSGTTGGNGAFGNFALYANTTGGGNVALGYSALTANTIGNSNVGVGSSALSALTTGSNNIAVGNGAGGNLSSSESNDIYIGSSGEAGESNTIRIGYIGTITAAAIAGIYGKTSASGLEVLVNESGLLGTTTSSRRFKHQIVDMGAESDVLMKLRPVAFYYKPELDGTQTRQYGLVAEEVAEVAPQLVVFDKDGAPESVRYHFVNAMLLNEVQKQRQLIEEQQRANQELNITIARQQEEIRNLGARVGKIETLLAGK